MNVLVQTVLMFFYQVTGARHYQRYAEAPLMITTQQTYALAA